MNRNQYWLLAACIVSFTMFLGACNKSSSTTTDSTSGNWSKRSQFNGPGRYGAVTFTIGDTAYVATGYDGTQNDLDCYRYDVDQNGWFAIDSFPGTGRNGAVAFTVNKKGYVVGGYDATTNTFLKDVWQYDPATTPHWTKKADFPGIARQFAIGFAIDNYGYVCAGSTGTGNLKDAYQYDAANDMWKEITGWGGSKRSGGVAFVHNKEAYVVTGYDNGTGVSDFYKFSPNSTASNKWSQLHNITNLPDSSFNTNYTDIMRQNGVGFIVGTGDQEKAYIATGQAGGYTVKTWEYDFKTDLWTRKTDFEFAARSGAIAFTLKGRGFVGLGGVNRPYYDNLAEFNPSQTKIDND